ncbi:AI-2E family transporter [Cereibacter changlensis]|uniref:AI-2E family transporter n=1 Tax=Cereibacter changlensis TaxID=402884 RepID=UPI00403318A9
MPDIDAATRDKRRSMPQAEPGMITGSPMQARRINLPTLATIAAVVAIIYFAQNVVLPLAIAMLITFALSPLATRLRRIGLPNLPAVLIVVTAAFVAIGMFILIVIWQLSTLTSNLPRFQANIVTKVESLVEAGSGSDGVIGRISNMVESINNQIAARVEDEEEPRVAGAAPEEPDPMLVEVVQDQSTLEMMQDIVLPLIGPIATTGLVVVVVVFMLLERAELRDRFIKLVGSNDLHRTTQVLQDAGRRVTQYLLVQLLVNIIYAVPIGVGLWFIGVPNALLWGLLTLVLRFIPYIGSVLSAAFPILLAFASSPDWSMVLWTIILFGVVETITSNAIEPWLYGSRTGVSPLAIIISAIFWTWLWGPLGLVMSTPLTVCLVVLGRHIPQFEVFDTLFGDEPVLEPHARLYQRLLAGDAIEATSRAEEALETMTLGEYYRDIGIPALLIAQNDQRRGVLTVEQQERVATTAQEIVIDLAEVVEEEREIASIGPKPEGEDAPDLVENAVQDGDGHSVLCVGGKNSLDDVSAAMLAQIMRAEGATAEELAHTDLGLNRFREVAITGVDCVVLSFVDPSPMRASLLHIRRIKRAAPHLRVGVVIWNMPSKDEDGDMTVKPAQVADSKLDEALEIGADFAVRTLDEALRQSFSKEGPKPVEPVRLRQRRVELRARPAQA